MIYFGLNLVFGMIGTLVQVNSHNQSGPVPTRQFVTSRGVIQDKIRALKRNDAVRAFSYAFPDLHNMFKSQARSNAGQGCYRPAHHLLTYTTKAAKDAPVVARIG